MRRMLTFGVVVVAAVLAGAARPADHAMVFGGVNVWRGSGALAAEYGSQYVPCSSTACGVTVALGKRDYNRFVKWCGAASKAVVVAVGDLGGHVICAGPSPWTLDVHVAMHNARDVLTAHAEPVTITISVTP